MYSVLKHFQNIHTFTYQTTLLHTLLLLVFKIVESLQCILKKKHIKCLFYVSIAMNLILNKRNSTKKLSLSLLSGERVSVSAESYFLKFDWKIISWISLVKF